MNQKLNIEKTRNTPAVVFDAGTGIMEITGRSIPENPAHIYQRLIDWIEAYFKNKPREVTRAVFQLEYVNSGSSRYLMEFFRILRLYHQAGNSVFVEWRYEEEDESIYDLGRHYKNTYNIPFEMEMIVL